MGKGASQHRLDRALPVPEPQAGAGPKERAGRPGPGQHLPSEPTWLDGTLGWECSGSAMPSEALWPSSKQHQR